MNDISKEFRELIAEAERVSADTGDIVRDVLQAGLDQHLVAVGLRLGRVLTIMRERAEAREDRVLTAQMTVDLETLIDRMGI